MKDWIKQIMNRADRGIKRIGESGRSEAKQIWNQADQKSSRSGIKQIENQADREPSISGTEHIENQADQEFVIRNVITY